MDEIENDYSPLVEEKCFICSGTTRLAEVSRIGFQHSGLSKLNCQLSIILLLRRILGISQDVLTELLNGGGNPSEWGIKLCGPCYSVFREAEFMHRRLMKFQADFEDLAKELRSLLLNSTGGACDELRNRIDASENVKKPRRKMGRPKSLSEKSIPCNIVEDLRNKFFEESSKNSLDPLITTKVLYTKQRPGTALDGIFTTQPVMVMSSEVNKQSMHNSNSRKRTSRLVTTRQIQQEVEENMVESSNEEEEDVCNNNLEDNIISKQPFIIKQEASNELQDYNLPDEDAIEYNDFPSSPPWLPENDDGMGDETPPEDVNSSGGDSDYEPEPALSKPKVKPKGKSHKIRKNVAARLREKRIQESLSKVSTQETYVEPIEENGSFRCPTCDVIISKKIECRAHILKEHYDDPLPFHCHVCDNKRFEEEKYLRKHLNRFHLGSKTPYDEEYDPELHSAEKLKNMVIEDDSWQSLTRIDNDKSSQDGGLQVSLEEIVNPQLPDDIIKQFRNDPKGSYQCSLCKRKFASEMLRDGHEKRTHQGIENPFQCTLCHKVFARRSRLLKHMVVVHFSNQHVCSQCGSRFADKVLLEGHVRRIHLGETNPYPCSICSRKFPKRVKLNQHLSNVHKVHVPKVLKKKVSATMISVPQILRPKSMKNPQTEDESIFECWVCSTEGEPMRFGSLEEKEEHIQTLHTSVEKPFICPAVGCDKKYATRGVLDYHLAKVHPEGIKVPVEQYYECIECKKKFSIRSELEAHMESHNSSPFVCDLCGKQYRLQKYLDDHQQQVHHKELKLKPHKCKECGKILNTAKSLDHHIKTKHTKETKFKCKECDFGTMYEKLLQRHVEIRHLKIAQALCPICSRPFATQFYLTQHMMRVHTKEKPYKCNECGKLFSDQPTFNRHKEAHSGRIHECPIETCKRQFNTRHAFRTHLKIHQKNGIMVEIPEFRYENEDENEEENSSSEAEATPNSDNNLTVLPDLKPEASLAEQCTDSNEGVASSNVNSKTVVDNSINAPPSLEIGIPECESIAFAQASGSVVNEAV
ncbi:unnamed protein product [Orchesella dallaii]|uniref:C2H2-type domain-containing protein n=1 Tax=Orchesella dallaii TaxID=48710 RepID=A0ABP1S3D7_9HEXA